MQTSHLVKTFNLSPPKLALTTACQNSWPQIIPWENSVPMVWRNFTKMPPPENFWQNSPRISEYCEMPGSITRCLAMDLHSLLWECWIISAQSSSSFWVLKTEFPALRALWIKFGRLGNVSSTVATRTVHSQPASIASKLGSRRTCLHLGQTTIPHLNPITLNPKAKNPKPITLYPKTLKPNAS